jgi:uroporphyrinogen III methyltransferase/synthase
MADLDEHFDWLVFTSPNGADFFFKQLLENTGDVRALGKLRLAVVGPSTAERLRAFSVKAALMPSTYGAKELGLELISRLKREGAACNRVLLIQGNRNDPELEQMLIGSGAEVTTWQVYETLPCDGKSLLAKRNRDRFEKEGAHWLLFASSSAVEHWQDLKLSPKSTVIPRVISMGPMTSEALKTHGFTDFLEAKEATIQGLVATLESSVGSTRSFSKS